jgi:hypothetical protein
MAQRDAAAKARGEFGTGFWNPKYRQSQSQTYSFRAVQPGAESYRSFSYQPSAIAVGDTVVVNRDGVSVMMGMEMVGAAPSGLEFTVTKVIDGWLGTVAEVDGRELKGWIWNGNVSLKQSATAESPQASLENPPTNTYRVFSYQPSQTSRTNARSERRKNPWQYPKSDPRRYRP